MQTITNRVKTVPPTSANNVPIRYDWLSLPLAEPNLGAPLQTGVFVLTSVNTGERGWTLLVTPKDFEDLLAQSITARDLVAFKFRAGENSILAPGISNSFILGDNITGGFSNTTFTVNLCAQEKIFNKTGGSLLLDTLTAYEFQAGTLNRKVLGANNTTFILGNLLTVGEPNYTYVNNLCAAANVRGANLNISNGGRVKLDEIIVTSLTAASAFNVITEVRTVVLNLTSLSADDIYAKGNITSAKTVSGIRGQFYELSATRFFAGNNITFGPFSNQYTYVLGENIAALEPNYTYVENLSVRNNAFIGGKINVTAGDINLDRVTTKELTASTNFIAGSGNRFISSVASTNHNSYIIGRDILGNLQNTLFVNNLYATDLITGVRGLSTNSTISTRILSANSGYFNGISAFNLNVGTNNRVLSTLSNAFVLGSNITAGYSNTTYFNNISVIGNVTITGNLSAASFGGAIELADTVQWVKDNKDTVALVNSLVTSQSAYWMEPIRRFDFGYNNLLGGDTSYSGMISASRTSIGLETQPGWTITRIVYTIVGTVSAVDKAFNTTWFGRNNATYTRIWP